MFNNGKIIFDYPDSWNLEEADTLNNPDCIATLSKGEENLINIVQFPTSALLKEFKDIMEDMISEEGGVIISSDIIKINEKNAIKLYANIDTPEINFDIHTFVFIEDNEIYIFELRTVENFNTSVEEFSTLVNSFKIL